MAKKHHLTIQPDVAAVLRRSVITDRGVTLPEQLARALYAQVNAVLVAAGGKWDRRAKMHIFPDDPRVRLGMALEQGGILDTKKAMQQFFTPAPLAAHLVKVARVDFGDVVLEPSAGAGSLALAARELGAIVWCVELDATLGAQLIAAGFATFVTDFLTVRPGGPQVARRVVMNPPFTGGQDIEHVEHALSFVEAGGCLVAIMGGGIVGSSLKRAVTFRDHIAARRGRITPLPAGSFTESGTDVSTVLVEVNA